MIQVGDNTIQGHRSIVINYDEYIDIAEKTDLGELPILVNFDNKQLRNVSVTDFGAKGDGITDDTRAIQRACDYVYQYGGGVVNIPIGIFVISRISVLGNVFLKGESRQNTILKQKTTENQAALSFNESSSGISDLKLIIEAE